FFLTGGEFARDIVGPGHARLTGRSSGGVAGAAAAPRAADGAAARRSPDRAQVHLAGDVPPRGQRAAGTVRTGHRVRAAVYAEARRAGGAGGPALPPAADRGAAAG